MATWEDGPEYAPLQRPDEFSDPGVEPLESVPNTVQQAALAPKERPQFDDPPAAVAPLETLVPPVEVPRDPQIPFEVAASTLTAESAAWSAAHWTPPAADQSGQASWPAPSGTPWSAPTSDPAWPAPTSPPTQPIGVHPSPSPPGLPAAATQQFFGRPDAGSGPQPSSYPPSPLVPAKVAAKDLIAAATPGVLVPLLLGALVYLLSPVLIAVAFGLSSRVTVARQGVRTALGLTLALVGFLAAISLLFGEGGFSDWWSTVGITSLVCCWGLLAVTLLLVYRELRNGRRPEPPRSTWG